MLHGRLRYFDEHIGEVEYEVYAKDTFDDFKLYILNGDTSNYTNFVNASLLYDKKIVSLISEDGNPLPEGVKELIDKATASTSKRYIDDQTIMFNPYEDKEPSDNRRLDIKKANKFKTNITNEEFCLRVSSLLRYMQITGRKNYNQNISTNSDDHFATERLVKIDDLGYIKYEMGLITEMYVKGKYVEFGVKTIPDDVFDEGVFKELKEKDKYGNILSNTPISITGFKLATDLLGFEYVSPITKEPVNIFGMYETIEDVIANNPDKNTSWILDRKYIIVTKDIMESILEEFFAYDGYIAFDTETTGLNITFKSRTGEGDELVGVVLSKERGTGYYFPLQHKLFENLCDGDHWYFMEKYMKPLLESKKIIGHNIKFDWKVSYIYDINVNFVYDTLLAFGVTKRYEEESYALGLSALVRNIFGLDMFDLKDFVTGGAFGSGDITFADLPYEIVRRYAPADADMTLSLFEFLEREAILAKYGAQTIFDLEVNFAKAVSYAEFFGYHINVPKIPEMREQIEGGMEKYKKRLFDIAGKEFNPNSPQQLMKIMYDDLGIAQIGEKRSTNKEILKTLSDYNDENGDPKYPFVVNLRKYRDNEGIFKNFLKRLHEFATSDGYIFSDTKQLGTDTGRTSAGDPNYQSYNDPVKKYVIPRPGFMHFDSDFSQIEYRVLASMAQQENLMAEFDDPDLDYHTYQASRMFGIPYSLVSKALRNQSKGINFGLPYGMGDSSLGTRIFGARNKENTAKAAQLRRKFFQGQEKIEEFFEVTRSNGVANGFTSTHFGRRRYYHRGTYSIAEIRRQAGNHVIQGTAADIYKIACCRLFNRIVDEGWLGKVLINVFVHDELLLEVHNSINPYYFFKAWREEFQVSIDGFCKLYAGAGVGKSWYDAKKQDLPPQYIDDLINMWSEDMPWDGNIDNFLKSVDEGYERYKIRRVKEYITDPSNEGEVIKPIINALLVEVVGNIVKELRSSENATELIAEYNRVYGSEILTLEGKPKIKLLKDYLFVYCYRYGVDHTKLNIKSPDEAGFTSSSDNEPQDEALAFDEATFSIEDFLNWRGYFRDDVKNIIYIVDKPMFYNSVETTLINFLHHRGAFKHEGDLQVAVYNPETKRTMYYNAYMDERDYQLLISTVAKISPTTPMAITQQGWGF